MSQERISRGLLIGLLLAMLAAPAFGCPVCFGESDSPIAQGANLSILFMACLTYLTIGGGVAAVVVLRRRQLRQGETPESHDDSTKQS